MFPLHFLYLMATTKHSSQGLWAGLVIALKRRLSDVPAALPSDEPSSFPWGPFVWLVSWLTIGMTLPSLLWFTAVSLAPYVYSILCYIAPRNSYLLYSITDVTALWNTNAFFAYVILVKVLGLEWDARRLGAVILATAGAAAVIYGGSTSPKQEVPTTSNSPPVVLSAPLVGDLLTLCASIGYGLYQVLYKVYVALPSDPDAEGYEGYTPVINSEDVHEAEDASSANSLLLDSEDVVYPPPFALYPNFLTSAIGLCTFLVLWIPLVILHILNIAPLALPPNGTTVLLIAGIALTGGVFNAGFMV